MSTEIKLRPRLTDREKMWLFWNTGFHVGGMVLFMDKWDGLVNWWRLRKASK